MTKTRLTELTNEIARLQEIDRLTSERVAAEADAKECNELQIPCSADLDNEMANESI